MTNVLEQLESALKDHSLSLTKPRKTVLGAMQNEEPQTVSEVVAKCLSVNRASVYRTISLFEELGIVQRLQIGWKYKLELTDNYIEHHHHLHCNGCGLVVPLARDNKLEKSFREVAKLHNFTLLTHQLELTGLCAKCAMNHSH